MNHYSLFGGCLRSELPFPELRPSADPIPRWTLRLSDSPQGSHGGELLGATMESPCDVQLYRTSRGFHLYHSCTGDYAISESGADITWRSAPDANLQMARIDVIGRVLSIAMHASGSLCLHGSGVAIDGAAIAFLAPKRYGKSTLAFSLVRAGARLITDDTFAVDPFPQVTVLPGVQRLRLCNDAAGRLIGSDLNSAQAADGKHVVDGLGDDQLMLDRSPLSAVYLLSPVRANLAERAVTRTQLPIRAAAMSLVRHAKVGALLGKSEAAVVIDRAVAVARTVPVYQLSVMRDLDRMDDVVDQLMEWHGAGCAGRVR